jgi:NAD(P)-dependent dehydrogenase (short-subunit alcohol dehydrogenase family)
MTESRFSVAGRVASITGTSSGIGPALLLCSPASDYITGQILYVDKRGAAK